MIFAATRHVPWALNTPKNVATNVVLFSAVAANSTPPKPNPLAGFEGSLRGTEEKKGKGGKERKRNPPEINLSLRPCPDAN